MPFTRERRQHRLVFEEDHPRWAGLELVTRVMQVGEYGQLLAVFARIDTEDPNMEGVAEQAAALARVAECFAELRALFDRFLISWDMTEEDGTPTTPADLDDEEVMALIKDWCDLVTRASPPLGGQPDGTQRSAPRTGLEGLPMAPLAS